MVEISAKKSEAAPGDGLIYQWKEPPESGHSIEVASGVHWIRMPLPFALDHINLWIIEDNDGCVLVDTGYNSSETKELWDRLFDGPFAHLKPNKLLCTHHHPDHMGLAGWLTETFDISMWATDKEWEAYHRWFRNDHDVVMGLMDHFYTRGGVEKERRERDLRRRQSRTVRTGAEPQSFELLGANDTVSIAESDWQVLIGEGHAPELAALHNTDKKLLISGDQILPKISPNVSIMPFELDADPLKLFMTSLYAFRELPADTMVLPSHKLPFLGLHKRIDALVQHHEERLEETVDACDTPKSAAAVTTVLFPRALNDHQYFFALGETLAHLNYLWHKDTLVREIGAAGQFEYSVA